MSIPVIDRTDLYHLFHDRGDNIDILTPCSLPEIDLWLVLLDATDRFRNAVTIPEYPKLKDYIDKNGPRVPCVIAMRQLNRICERDIPWMWVLFTLKRSSKDDLSWLPRGQKVEKILLLAFIIRKANSAPMHHPSFQIAKQTTFGPFKMQSKTGLKTEFFYAPRKNEQVAMSRPVPSPGKANTWDSFRVCDPPVIAEKFSYLNETYAYALFYLDNNVNASRRNQIGVAFANDLADKQWARHSNCIIYCIGTQWGVVQLIAASLGGELVLIRYNKGHDGRVTYQQELDLRNMDSKPIYLIEPHSVTNMGLTRHNGSQDHLNNLDTVYYLARECFYAVRGQCTYPLGHPNYTGANVQLVSAPAENIFHGGGEWVGEGQIDEVLNGIANEHNVGFICALSGALPDPNVAQIIFTDSCGDSANCNIPDWICCLWKVTIFLEDQPK